MKIADDWIAQEFARRKKWLKNFHITKDVDGLVARGIHAYHYWGLVKLPNKILTKQCSPKSERKFTLIARRHSAQRFKK